MWLGGVAIGTLAASLNDQKGRFNSAFYPYGISKSSTGLLGWA